VNRSLPDAISTGLVDRLPPESPPSTNRTIADAKRLVNVASLPPDIEIESVERLRCFDGTTGHAAENQNAV